MSSRATAKALIDAIEQDHWLKYSVVVPAADFEKMVGQIKEIAAAAGDMKQDGYDTLQIETEMTTAADITFLGRDLQGTDPPVSMHSDSVKITRSETLRVVLWGDGTAVVFRWGAETLRMEPKAEPWRKHIGKALNARNLRLGFTPPPELNIKEPARTYARRPDALPDTNELAAAAQKVEATTPARRCAECGALMEGKRRDAQYCSRTCAGRVMMRRARSKQKKSESAEQKTV